MFSHSDTIRAISAKIKKGEIRNTVLNQIKSLEEGIKDLTSGKNIKKDEIKEYEKSKPAKTSVLKKQIKIMEEGINHMEQAMTILKKYKNHTTS
jgi:hypothetical protein